MIGLEIVMKSTVPRVHRSPIVAIYIYKSNHKERWL
nr:MAG TPA: hypothetical protein [Caudoviricetes sp.]